MKLRAEYGTALPLPKCDELVKRKGIPRRLGLKRCSRYARKGGKCRQHAQEAAEGRERGRAPLPLFPQEEEENLESL